MTPEDRRSIPVTIEERIAAAVQEAIQRTLGPYVRSLGEPEPVVYTVPQAASVLQVSEDTIGRLVRRGVLARVPHLDGRVLIPRAAVDRLVNDDGAAAHDTRRVSSAVPDRSLVTRDLAGGDPAGRVRR